MVPSDLETTENPDGTLTVWCLQPLVDSSCFLPAVLSDDPRPIYEKLVSTVTSTIEAQVGLDAQVSNWVLRDGRLSYLDVTTPLLRGDDGRELLDLDLFIASLPWALRGAVRRFLLGAILDKYYEPRGALLDIAGNLQKEGLGPTIPTFLQVANAAVDRPITEAEVHAYYREDARMWALLQRLRRLDRAWQRSVRRRVYPFLLPGEIERRV